MFTASIPIGKLDGIYLIINSFKKYLEIAPKNPPKPIKKYSFFFYNLKNNTIFIIHIVTVTNYKFSI